MKKAFRLSFFVSIVLCLVYSFSIAQRHTETLNEVWQFHKGNIDSPFAENEEVEWEVVNLPHSWNTQDVLDETPGYYRGVGWYKRNLQVPALYSNQKVFLYFEGANQKTEVFINGNQAEKEHIGGYTPFAIEITDFLTETGNELVVKVDNSYDKNIIPLSGDFNFFGGIYRDVYLVITHPQHFDMNNLGSNGIFVTTPEVSEESAKISISSTWVNQGLKNTKLTVKYTLLDAQRKEVAHTSTKSKTDANTSQTVKNEIEIAKPNLWSPNNPYLYTLKAELLDTKGNMLDMVENPVGFRWFSFDPQKGFYLNGKPLKLIGSNRHQDYYHKANALTNEMHRYDMKLLKEMGINFIRISHYPHDPAMLEMCDRYGFIASLEIPFVNKISTSEAFLTNTENMMQEAITSNFNHPCIVAWCTGNETTMYNSEDEAYQTQRRKIHITLDSLVRAEDSTRYTYTVAFRSPDFHSKIDILHTDIIGFNKYFGWYENHLEDIGSQLQNMVDQFKKSYPSKTFILSEYGAGADPRLHTFKPSRFDFSVEYQLLLHQAHLRKILETSEIVGSTIWNFADFMAEPRVDAVPHINNKGVVTIDRRPKDSYYFYKTALSKEPFVVIPSKLWSQRGGRADEVGKPICTQPVEIFSNLPEAELFLNNVSLGIQPFSFYSSTWQVPFKNGENLLEVRAQSKEGLVNDFLKIDFQLQPYDLKSEKTPFSEIAINVGSYSYFIEASNNNYLWFPDQPYSEGSWGYVGGNMYMDAYHKSIGSKHDIYGTENDPLYQSQQVGIETYKLDVSKGRYEVTLLLAELEKDMKNDCNLNILINGVLEWANLNLEKEYGLYRGVSKMFLVEVIDENGITISFEPNGGKTILNGLKVRKVY